MTFRSRLNWVEWSLLGVMVPYLALGLFTNYWRVRPEDSSAPIDAVQLELLMTVGLMVLLIVLVAALLTRQVNVQTYGFRVSKRSWLDALLVVVSTLLVSRETALGLHFGDLSFYFAVVGASLEEVFFRAIVIGLLLKICGVNWRTILCAVVFGAALFASGHIPSHSWMQLQGVFVGAVIFGFVFAYTRSILFAGFFHVFSNTSDETGLFGALIWLAFFWVVVGVDWGIGRIRARKVLGAGV